MKQPSSKEPNICKTTKQFLKDLETKLDKPLYDLPPNEARIFLNSLQHESYKNIDVSIEDKMIYAENQGSIALRIIRPQNNNDELPAIVYLHGGGWVLGNKDTHDMLIRKLSICTNTTVIFVEYSPSPEAKFPAAINQTFAVLEYLQNHSYEFNINKDKIIIAGDSAGANIAAAVTMKAKYCDKVKILMQVLLYPVTSADMDTKSYDEFKDGPWLTKKAMKYFWNEYLQNKDMKNDIYASILNAPLDLLEGLPTTLVITAENDVLRDEGEMFARKLTQAGVDIFSVRINGAIHDFLMLNALAETTPVKGAFKIICTAINDKIKGA